MKTVRILTIISLLIVSMSSSARTILWDKKVVRLNLIVGVEQMIHFPVDGEVGLPPSLVNDNAFRTLFTGQTAYWTALVPFDSQRIKVKLDTGEFILFDVAAKTEKKPPRDIETITIIKESVSENYTDTGSTVEVIERATLFDLIRYAAQVIYAPSRLVEPVPDIREVPIGLKGNINRVYNHQDHHGLVFYPHKSWTAADLYVTAITVKNEHTHSIKLDSRLVQHTKNSTINGVGQHFIASSFFTKELQKKGEKGDMTTLFIVTGAPFQSAIRL